MNHVQRTEPFAATLETPKSAMKSTTKCSGIDAVEPTGISQHTDGIDVKNKGERKESHSKIKFVQYENTDEQNYQTPISCKLNTLMMCFKSEPDLSRVQSISENVPMLHRGRFIAKKLLSGVSMINLRRPFANGSEKATTTTATESSTSEMSCAIQNAEHVAEKNVYETPASHCMTDVCSIIDRPAIIANDKIEDDDEDFVDDEEVDREYDDSIDKENRTPVQTAKIGYLAKFKQQQQQQQSVPAIDCNSGLLDSMGNDSVSPITKSTHRMSKAMQVMRIIAPQKCFCQ